ncbi:junctophilin-1-like [Centruroides sculpturatus]|uniref:junctophilin-1-like n=1 Tax=Centruroides sculpturatus TaxID=218467 RepID=UPI000C6D1989|nr:junctophilin-1-like [Centruroides sculpturatus]
MLRPELKTSATTGGRFDFDDGGTYCGGWEDGKAHGHGVCTGPKGQGEYSGSWHYGFEVSGVYTWPSGSTYEGQWQNGKRHGLGMESRGRWIYRGEWTQGFKGRYGVRQSISSGAKYEGTWANGLQDGYGSESYADNGTYQGQWMRGMRHGYGVRTSANFGLASHHRQKATTGTSLSSLPTEPVVDVTSDRDRKMDDFRGGFVLKSRSDEPPARRRSLVEKSTNFKKSILQGLRLKKQRSTGDIDRRGVSSVRSSGSNLSSASSESSQSGLTQTSVHTDSNASFVSQDDIIDSNVIETYMGEWKNDKRCGFGIAERSDGLKYEGEWYNNKKYGYGVTTLKDGTREEGKYKNNVLVTSGKKKHLFLLRSAKFKERVEAAVNASIRASQIALQKADIAISRTATARGKAEQADVSALHAREDMDIARLVAKQFAPEFHQPGTDALKRKLNESREPSEARHHIPAREQTPILQHQHYPPTPHQYSNQHLSQVPHQYSNQHQSQLHYPNQHHTQVPNQYSNQLQTQVPNQNQVHNQYPNQSTHHFQRNRPSYLQATRESRYGISSLEKPTINHPDIPQKNVNVNYLDPLNSNKQDQARIDPSERIQPPGSVRRNPSYRAAAGDPHYTIQQALNDHFDHYQYDAKQQGTRKPRAIPSSPIKLATSAIPSQRQGTGYGADCTPDSGVSESMDNEESSPLRRRINVPQHMYTEAQSSLLSVAPSDISDRGSTPSLISNAQQVHEEDIQQNFTPLTGPQRTASLYIKPPSKIKPPPQAVPANNVSALKRKKSLPNIAKPTEKLKVMPREEVSVLSSIRREEMRKEQATAERLRSNPLLYLVNPDVKDWFSRQQLVMLVLFVNISLAIMFFKLLT